MVASRLVWVVALLGCSEAERAPGVPLPAVVTELLGELRTGAGCADQGSPLRLWCTAVGFATGTAAALPSGALVGFRVPLERGKPVRDTLMKRMAFAALVVSADRKVTLTDVTPSDEGQAEGVFEATVNVATVLKGRAKVAKVPADLARYLKSFECAHAATRGAQDWTWEGPAPARLRKVGDAWVVIEVPKSGDGIVVTVLTERWE
jgi:hypothetical protein